MSSIQKVLGASAVAGVALLYLLQSSKQSQQVLDVPTQAWLLELSTQVVPCNGNCAIRAQLFKQHEHRLQKTILAHFHVKRCQTLSRPPSHT